MDKRSFLRLFAAGILLPASRAAGREPSTQAWPEQTVTIVTPSGPGGSPDFAARVLAEALAKRWKQPIVVVNRPGADTMIATQAFVDKRDRHSLLFTPLSTFTVVPLLYDRVPYDPVNDVTPISLAVEDFLGVVAAPALAVDSLPDFVSLAREKPGQLNFFVVPGAPYLAYLAFQKRVGMDTVFVGYTTSVIAINDMAEARIHIAVMPLASVLAPVSLGKIKLLAVTNDERALAAPSAPTVKEAGYPDLSFGGFLGLFGARDMSPDLRGRIASDVSFVLAEPNIKQRLQDAGLIARGTTPEELASTLDAQRVKWSSIAREHNIRPQQPR
jgi:tripartite-type tricarboxylate transporter receptor subunit TctC